MNPTAAAHIESALRAVADGNAASADFTIVYNDMHGLYGGETITVNGDGTLQGVWQLRPGDVRSEYAGTVSPTSLRELAALLLDLHAWRQDVPEGVFVPDTVFAYCRIYVGTETTDIWELRGQLDRLGQIRRAMEALVPALANRQP